MDKPVYYSSMHAPLRLLFFIIHLIIFALSGTMSAL